MDKKKKKTTPAPRLEKEEMTDDRKRTRQSKKAEPEASSKTNNSEFKQQLTRSEELSDTKCNQSDGNVRLKIGVVAKRTKKPPKSLENFICRPTIRISQRLSHGDGHSSSVGEVSDPDPRLAKKSHRDVQKKDCLSTKGSKRVLPTSKKGDSTPVIAAPKKAPSKNTRKTESKSLLTSDGPSYAVQPQTDSKVPLSDKITSSTLLKQTHSPPAAPSPPSSLPQNSSPQDSTQVLNAQKEKSDDLPTEEAMTSSFSSDSSKNMTQNTQISQHSSSSLETHHESTSSPKRCSENSLRQTLRPTKKTSRTRETNADRVLNANEKEDGDYASSKNMSRSRENGLLHQPSLSIKAPLLPPATDKSAESATPENNTNISELQKNRGRCKKHSGSEVIDDSKKLTMEPAKTVAVQSKDVSRVGHVIEKNKKRTRHCSNQEENVKCSPQTSSGADSQFNSSAQSEEPPLHPKQDTISQKTQKSVQITNIVNQGENMDLGASNVNSTACKNIPQKSKGKRDLSMKSSKELPSQQGKLDPVRQPLKSKELQKTSPRSETAYIEPPIKRRGRPKITKMDESPQGSKSQQSSSTFSVLEHSNLPGPEHGLKLPKPTPKIQSHPKCPLSAQTKKSKSLHLASGKTGAEGKLKPSVSRVRDAQICRKRNKLIMRTIIKNINKMRVKRKDKVLTQFLSGQSQNCTTDMAQKDNEGDAECSVSDGAQSLSSLVTSFGGKLGPQINVSKRGTIYIGKRRGRKPKAQMETFGQDSGQVQSPKTQQVSTESSNQLNRSTSGEQSQSFDGHSALHSSPYSFKQLKPPSSSISSFRRKLYPGSCKYDQHSSPKVTSSQKFKAMPEEKSKHPTSSQPAPCPSATSQLGSVRIQDHRATHLARSVLMEQERLKYKCPRKGHNCFSHEKIRRHKHKCKKKYLQLRAKRQDPAFLAEVEELVVRLSEIHIVHHLSSRGCGDEAKPGRKSGKGKAHPHVLQCLPQNLHHPTMFQINFSGYYSPQSEFSRDSLHYVGLADFKRNNGCPSQPGEHIVTHCPVVHKLGFPLSAGGCYHSPYKMPVPTTSFGFGLYRGYPPSATIYPSSPFLPSYVHPYSKNPILSPSKFHKRKHKFLRHESEVCHGKPHGTYTNLTSHSSSDWFSRNSWQRQDDREQGRDKRFVDDRFREREGLGGLLGQSNLRKGHFRRGLGLSTDYQCSTSAPSKQADKHKTSPLSYIGPAHLRPLSKVRWAEHRQPWRWRESVQVESKNRGSNQEGETGYHEDDDEVDEDQPSPPPVDRSIHHHTFLRNTNLASAAFSQMTSQRSVGEVQCAARNLMTAGSSLMESCSTGGKRSSESFKPGGSLFSEHYSNASLSFNEGQERGAREKRPSISKTHFQTSDIRLFSSCSATKNSLSHFGSSKDSTPDKEKLKHVSNPLRKKSLKGQAVTGGEVKRRGRGRPRKNPAPCFSPPPPPVLVDYEVTECSPKRKKDERDDYATESMAQHEKRKRKRKRDDSWCSEGQIDEDVALSHEPSHSHTDTFSPSKDPISQSESRSSMSSEKKYEWAGLYSDVYKSENPKSLSSPVYTECLEYDPEEHEHGLLPAPLHVGKYLRLKRIDFQLPYEIYRLCAHKKHSKKSKTLQKMAPSNEPVDVMSHTQTEESCCKPHDCISDSTDKNDTDQQTTPTEEPGEEVTETDINNTPPNQSDPPKQQEKGSDAENIPSPLLMMPLSCEERSFVLEHGVFLVRNYEKMRDRQGFLLREEMVEPENESRGDGEKQKEDLEDTSSKSDQRLSQWNLWSGCRERGEERRSEQSPNLMHTLQGIYDVIVSHKGSSGQTLAAPLLNLCSRKRSGSAPVDLTMLQKQLHSGHYESLEAFHSDMLKVFHCAEKYYGCESSVGRNVGQLREVYHAAHQEAFSRFRRFL
ncbi:histone-lysine N-methyltransferase ASH1L-like isoform X1 [Danio aesculapii]|uniref:histone-lysine N-methyltransferase ASH1L-like isoform X1 n=1 Tax=Danio aesculapii TaxID=1142201 RepID=UPI0024C0AA30|nr:histone-lysine N-methyltransferase ASH1L-like isoform X1 [Danio aesculapii]